MTQQGIQSQNMPSGRFRRGVSFIIDLIFGTFIGMCLISISGFFIPMDNKKVFYLMIPAIFLSFVYVAWSPLFFKNSFGKFLLKIKVINDSDLNKPTRKQYLLRGIFIILWPIEAIALLISKTKKRLGDKVAGTLMILDTENKLSWFKRLIIFIVILIIVYFFVIFLMGLSARNTGIYKSAVNFIINNKIGESAYGTPLKIGYIPKNISMQKSSAFIVIPVTWPQKSGFVALLLQNENGTWLVKDGEIRDESGTRGYSYNY